MLAFIRAALAVRQATWASAAASLHPLGELAIQKRRQLRVFAGGHGGSGRGLRSCWHSGQGQAQAKCDQAGGDVDVHHCSPSDGWRFRPKAGA
jgi:hypothetical protein